MGIKEVYYSINGSNTTPPDEEVWTPISPGSAGTGLQKRSPYRQLEWRKTVAGPCHLDWFDYDNTRLTSLATRPPGLLDETVVYTDVICQSVTMRQRQGAGSEIVAVFLVYVG